MKSLATVLFCLCVSLIAADKKPLIADPIVEKAIREQLKKPEGELTKVDLEKVGRLSLADKQLTEVPKGLESLTKLTSLSLYKNKLTDGKGLEKLTRLRYLDLWDNPDLTKAQIDQLSKALPKCAINHNAKLDAKKIVKPATGVATDDQSAIVEKAIRRVLPNGKPTGELTKADLDSVRYLFLTKTPISDEGLKELAKLPNLEILRMGYTKVTNQSLKEVAKMGQLSDLNVAVNGVTDEGLKALVNLKNLTKLDLGGCKVTKAGVAQLQKALPNCKIRSNPTK